MEKYFKPKSRSNEIESSSQKKARVEFNANDIIVDPGLRKPIEEYNKEIRDEVRRAYLLNGPTQPIGHNFPSSPQGDRFRSFQESWFEKFDWLEYSVANDSTYCFYCYLFKQPLRGEKFGYEAFTRHGYRNWKNALDTFKKHVDGVNSSHNKARQDCRDFQNQRQSVSYVMTTHSREGEIAYRVRLTSVLHVTRFLAPLIVVAKQNMQQMRDNGYDELLEEVEEFCLKMTILVPNMNDKVPSRGRSRRGGQMISFSHRYHVDIFVVVLDSLLVEMNVRFSEASTNLLRCISSLDPKDSLSKFDQEKLIELASIYSHDFSPVESTFLRGELGTFITDVRNSSEFSTCHDFAALAIQMVQTKRYVCYPLVYRLIELALILPVATATVERAFSAMKIIKTELRNKMADDWMNDNMICYIEREVFAAIDDEKILQRFQNMRTRKYQLCQVNN